MSIEYRTAIQNPLFPETPARKTRIKVEKMPESGQREKVIVFPDVQQIRDDAEERREMYSRSPRTVRS